MEAPSCFVRTFAIILSVAISALATFAVCSKIFDKKYITVSE